MNPLLLLLLGLGSFMAFTGGSKDETGSTTEAANSPGDATPPAQDNTFAPEPEAPEPSVAPEEDTPATVEVTMVLYDMASEANLREISEGDEIDFEGTPVGDYTVAVEVSTEVGSVIFKYAGQ